MSLNEQVAVVTGGGSGIGAAVARSLADAGCRVIVVGRRAAVLDEVAAHSDRITTAAADVGDREAVQQVIAKVLDEQGRVDLLINSAGTNTPKRSMEETSAEDWERILNVNASGAFHCMQAVLPGMRERKGGTIVNISSVAGIRANPLGGVAYNSSKFAMSALGASVGEEERTHGIRVTNIYPGEVETPILDARPVPVTPEHRARILQPEDVADAVLMVCALPPRARIPDLVIVPTTQSFV